MQNLKERITDVPDSPLHVGKSLNEAHTTICTSGFTTLGLKLHGLWMTCWDCYKGKKEERGIHYEPKRQSSRFPYMAF